MALSLLLRLSIISLPLLPFFLVPIRVYLVHFLLNILPFLPCSLSSVFPPPFPLGIPLLESGLYSPLLPLQSLESFALPLLLFYPFSSLPGLCTPGFICPGLVSILYTLSGASLLLPFLGIPTVLLRTVEFPLSGCPTHTSSS